MAFSLRFVVAALLVIVPLSASAQAPWTTTQFPQDADKWWWDDAWWERGTLAAPANHPVVTRKSAYTSGGIEIPVDIHAPAGAGRHPVVVFMHGRRGMDELIERVPRRLAARGFTVVAPDFFTGQLIESMPIPHDPAIEDDAARAIDFALALPEARGQPKTCVVSLSRGGYYALKALVTKQRQRDVACYVASYPHWQDPAAPEPLQVYQYAPEVDALEVPVLVFLGEHEQYQRVRSTMAGIDSLRSRQRDARVIVYPGVGRGFDFRGPAVRTFADDLAAKDSLHRTAEFMRTHLGTK